MVVYVKPYFLLLLQNIYQVCRVLPSYTSLLHRLRYAGKLLLPTTLYVLSIIFQMLNNIDLWGVDIFSLASVTNNRPLTTIAYRIFQVINTWPNYRCLLIHIDYVDFQYKNQFLWNYYKINALDLVYLPIPYINFPGTGPIQYLWDIGPYLYCISYDAWGTLP